MAGPGGQRGRRIGGRRIGGRGRGRRRLGPWLARLAALALLIAAVFAAWLWWDMRSWKPDEATYPEQGAMIASGAAPLRFETIRALGASFVYLALPLPGGPADPGFAERLRSAKRAGLKVGVIQPFDPCLSADRHSADFTRLVPRDGALLPPAIALGAAADACLPKVSDAAVESELMTMINQIEAHAGKPAILKLESEFEARYRISALIERDLWLARDRARPGYATRPWLLWSANSALESDAGEEPVEWVVVQN